MVSRISLSALCVLALVATAAAQQPSTTSSSSTARPETRAALLQRLGLSSDPGPDPDPTQVYLRYGKRFHIERFALSTVRPDPAQKGWVTPSAYVGGKAELYQENDKFAWVFIAEPELRQPILDPEGHEIQTGAYTKTEIPYLQEVKNEMEELTPRKSDVALTFEESSTGLPQTGSWRNGVAAGDFNEDGKIDIVAPPQRTPLDNSPSIFLGDGKGGWKRWDNPWPTTFSYGNVAVGDLNRDGHLDLVFAVHLSGTEVLLGDGKGNFTESIKGMEDKFPTRKVVLADLDGNGSLDVVALTEGPKPHMEDRGPEASKLIGFLNDGKGSSWKKIALATPGYRMGGDWMATGDFNGDRKADIATSSNYFSNPDVLYLGEGKSAWKPVGRGFLPFLSYYYSPVAGRFTSSKRDDVIFSFVRSWPNSIDPEVIPWPKNRSIVGIERISWENGKAVRTPIARWPGQNAVWGMGSGDFDGDGNLDIVYARSSPREMVILLGDGKGHFRRSDVSGIELPVNPSYDLTVADVNGDGRPDIIVPFEDATESRTGSIRVYLNRGAGKATK